MNQIEPRKQYTDKYRRIIRIYLKLPIDDTNFVYVYDRVGWGVLDNSFIQCKSDKEFIKQLEIVVDGVYWHYRPKRKKSRGIMGKLTNHFTVNEHTPSDLFSCFYGGCEKPYSKSIHITNPDLTGKYWLCEWRGAYKDDANSIFVCEDHYWEEINRLVAIKLRKVKVN